jgi:polygalacturonase
MRMRMARSDFFLALACSTALACGSGSAASHSGSGEASAGSPGGTGGGAPSGAISSASTGSSSGSTGAIASSSGIARIGEGPAGAAGSGSTTGISGSAGAGAAPAQSSGGSGPAGSTSGSTTGNAPCGSGDPVLQAAGVTEPALPADSAVCQTLQATQVVPDGGVPNENALDTAMIQSALSACNGRAVRLVVSGSNNAFVTEALTIDSTTLWVDVGVTLFMSQSLSSAGITVKGTSPAIVGDGVIDGQGGERTTGAWPGPPLIEATGSHFTLYKVQVHNSPGFHVKITGVGFVIWGTTLLTPSRATNTKGAPLNPQLAHNTDGIDPGAGAAGADTTHGFIVCNTISVGDDHIAIKGQNGHVHDLTIAHNHFGAGHGMSIGSETGPGGIDGVNVYDLTVDGTVFKSASAVNANGIRIKSYQGAGGLVTNVTYQDICVRDVANPILLEPNYTSGTVTGGGTPQFTGIDIQDFHDVNDSSSRFTPVVTLDGYDASHMSQVTLDNVVVDGTPTVIAKNTAVTIGPGGASFTVPGAAGDGGTPTPVDCSGRWIPFPVTFP